MVQNKSLMFVKVPEGLPEKGKHLEVVDLGFDLDADPPKGGITIRNFYSSFDPYMRGRMRDPETKSYSAPFELNKPITSANISRVLKSDTEKLKPGDIIRCFAPVQEYSALPATYVGMCQKIDNPYNLNVMHFLGALGMPGITAYSSLYEIGEPKKGETIFVSAASGAVGSLVGQLAKHEGLKVIGSVGDDAKLDYILNELKFDGGFNYKKEKPADALARLAPEGLDIYFENVGGETLQAAFDAMKNFGRIVVCGMISQYNLSPSEQMPLRNVTAFIAKRIRMQGFIQSDKNFAPKWSEEHQRNMQKWIAEGSFKEKLHITKGMDNAVDGLLGIFSGKNFGKAILEIADWESEK